MAPNDLQGKHWLFTINNPVLGSIQDMPDVWPDVGYVVWQLERGVEGTEHFQGYVQFEKYHRLSKLKKLSPRAHWERRRGTHEQAKEYCTKEDTRVQGPFEKGTEIQVEPGKRNDLLAIKRKLDEGSKETAIAQDEEFFGTWCRHYKAFERYKRLCTNNLRTWLTYVIVYWGPPGVGKTRRARAEAGPLENQYWLAKPKGNQGCWWDGYDGQDTVVIDEFYGWISRDLMCRLCDAMPLLVETKGGSTPFLAKKIIITSNSQPADWWPRVGLGAMRRRLEGDLGEIVLMNEPYPPPEPVEQPHDYSLCVECLKPNPREHYTLCMACDIGPRTEEQSRMQLTTLASAANEILQSSPEPMEGVRKYPSLLSGEVLPDDFFEDETERDTCGCPMGCDHDHHCIERTMWRRRYTIPPPETDCGCPESPVCWHRS